MNYRWLMVLVGMPCVAGPVSCSCGDENVGVDETGGQTQTGSDTGAEEQTGSTGSAETSTGTDASSEGTSGTDTGRETPGRARVIFTDRDENDTNRLYWIDYDGGPVGTAQTVHGPLEPGDNVLSLGATSPDRRWIAFTVVRAATQSHELIVLDVANPEFPDPMRVNLAPAPDPGIAVGATFSPDSSLLAFTGGADTSGEYDLFLVDLAADELAPVQINPVLGPGGGVDPEVSFSPDGQRIAYLADMTGSGSVELYIQQADIADPGDPIQISNGGGSSPHWTPDGDVLFYQFDDDGDGIGELCAVDVSGAPSAPEVHDPGDTGVVRWLRYAPDGRGLTYWLGDDQALYGELRLVPIDGAAFGPPVTLSETAFVKDTVWAPDSTKILFESTDDGAHEAWLVELDGTTPGPEMKVNESLGAEEEVAGVLFGPDSSAVYYFVTEPQGIALFRADIGNGSVGPSLQLSLPETYPSEELIFSEDGSQALFTARIDTNMQNLYWLDLSQAEPVPVQLNPSDGPAASTNFGSKFSPEGPAVFYTADQGFEMPQPLYAVSTDAPGEATFLAGEGFVLGVKVFALP